MRKPGFEKRSLLLHPLIEVSLSAPGRTMPLQHPITYRDISEGVRWSLNPCTATLVGAHTVNSMPVDERMCFAFRQRSNWSPESAKETSSLTSRNCWAWAPHQSSDTEGKRYGGRRWVSVLNAWTWPSQRGQGWVPFSFCYVSFAIISGVLLIIIPPGHFAAEDVKAKLSELNQKWEALKAKASQRRQDLEDSLQAQQYFADANEAESWMREKEPIVGSTDYGKDEDSAEVPQTWASHVHGKWAQP